MMYATTKYLWTTVYVHEKWNGRESVGWVCEWKNMWTIGYSYEYNNLDLRIMFNCEDLGLVELTKGRHDWNGYVADQNIDITAVKKPNAMTVPLCIAELSCYIRLLLKWIVGILFRLCTVIYKQVRCLTVGRQFAVGTTLYLLLMVLHSIEVSKQSFRILEPVRTVHFADIYKV
jgi:hypothetical protein